jgi:sarcosine/dimethylglycine N-methyltransferase
MTTVDEQRVALKNEEAYSHATNAIWRMAVYEPLHSGWRFANIGGRELLDFAGRVAGLIPSSHVLELCSGLGDTCRYVAERFGCRVTGVELNARQVEHARAAGMKRVRFIEADVRSFETADRFDAILALDSLALVPDLDVVLRKARGLLAEGGVFILSDTVAGPNLTEAMRSFMWDCDAVVNLPSLSNYCGLLEDAGLRPIDVADLTDSAGAAFRTIVDRLRVHEAALVRECGAREHAGWLDVSARYEQAFWRRELLYTRVAARSDQ